MTLISSGCLGSSDGGDSDTGGEAQEATDTTEEASVVWASCGAWGEPHAYCSSNLVGWTYCSYSSNSPFIQDSTYNWKKWVCTGSYGSHCVDHGYQLSCEY